MGTKKILEIDFGSGSYISAKKKLPVSNFGEAEHKS